MPVDAAFEEADRLKCCQELEHEKNKSEEKPKCFCASSYDDYR